MAAADTTGARPWLGLTAVLLGTFLATLTGRLSTFGLADIRGAIHAGVDDGAWITTAQTCGQMLVTPLTVWAGGVYGPRRVLFAGAAIFGVSSTLIPFATALEPLLALQFLAGLGSGTFIPLTLPVLLRTVKPKAWAYGIVAYALALEISLNVSASLEAWYIDYLSWRFIFWQSVPLTIAMLGCVHFGLARQPLPPVPKRPDLFGVMSAAIGLAFIYAALDQGNRLNWLESGTIVGLLAAGVVLLGAALLHLRFSPSDWFDPGSALRWPIPVLLLMVLVLRLTILSTAFLIPEYLITVRGYRSLEAGQAMVWIAIPQLVAAPVAALLLRRIDSRWIACTGLIAVGGACWLVSSAITPQWGPLQFVPTQILQSLGQMLALSGVILTSVQFMRPASALTFGAMLQTSRLMGGEIGVAFTVTLVRIREQIASNEIGRFVVRGAANVGDRLQHYAVPLAPRSGGQTQQRSLALLADAVRQAAAMQSYIDGFVLIGLVAFGALAALLSLCRAPHSEASYRPLRLTFWRRRR